MALSRSDVQKIKDAFNEAAKGPYADVPAMGSGAKKLTVREVANEVQNETPIGKMILWSVDMAVSSGQATVDQIVQTIKNPPAPPKP
jgi:hypothetical protein